MNHWQKQDRTISEWIADDAVRQHFKKQVDESCEMAEAFAEMFPREGKKAHKQYKGNLPKAAAAKADYDRLSHQLREIYSNNDGIETDLTVEIRGRIKELKCKGSCDIVLHAFKRGPACEGHVWFGSNTGGYYKLGEDEIVPAMWIPPDPPNVVGWFEGLMYLAKTPIRSEAERRLYSYVLLAVLHDERQAGSQNPLYIYRDAVYKGPRFQRDKFLRDLWYRMNENPAYYDDEISNALAIVEKDLQSLRPCADVVSSSGDAQHGAAGQTSPSGQAKPNKWATANELLPFTRYDRLNTLEVSLNRMARENPSIREKLPLTGKHNAEVYVYDREKVLAKFGKTASA